MKLLNRPIFATSKKPNKKIMFTLQEIVTLLSLIPELAELDIFVNELSKDKAELIVGNNAILIQDIKDR